jgi:hypothetical protein
MNTIVGPTEVLFRQVSLYLDSCHLRHRLRNSTIEIIHFVNSYGIPLSELIGDIFPICT